MRNPANAIWFNYPHRCELRLSLYCLSKVHFFFGGDVFYISHYYFSMKMTIHLENTCKSTKGNKVSLVPSSSRSSFHY